MSLSVIWSANARRQRDRLDPVVRARVLEAVDQFAMTLHGDVKRLKGFTNEYRLRAGDWRIRFEWNAPRGEIEILHVLHRREAYR